VTRKSLLTDLRVVVALGWRSIKQAFRRPQFLAPVIVFPSLLLAVNTGGAGRAVDLPAFPEVGGFLDFELAGAILQAVLLAGVSGGIALALDIEIGFMDRLLAAPVARWTIVVGRLAATAALGLLAAVWFLAVGLVFGAEIVAGVGGAVVVIALTTLAAGAFGGFAAALALKTGRASVVQGIFPLAFVVLFVSSAFFPRDLLLEPASAVADWNPLSYIAEAVRDPVVSTLSAEELWKGLAAIGFVAVFGIAASALAFRARLRAS
jgi:ABC-2 type transport system permease protein